MSSFKKCPHCKKDIDVRGWRMHVAMCKESAAFKEIKSTDLKNQKKTKDADHSNVECEHNFVLLGNSPEHIACKRAGYKAICTKCEELQ